jgi:hypothetical protein
MYSGVQNQVAVSRRGGGGLGPKPRSHKSRPGPSGILKVDVKANVVVIGSFFLRVPERARPVARDSTTHDDWWHYEYMFRNILWKRHFCSSLYDFLICLGKNSPQKSQTEKSCYVFCSFLTKQYRFFSNYSASYNLVKYIISELVIIRTESSSYLLWLSMSKIIPLPPQTASIVRFDFVERFNNLFTASVV